MEKNVTADHGCAKATEGVCDFKCRNAAHPLFATEPPGPCAAHGRAYEAQTQSTAPSTGRLYPKRHDARVAVARSGCKSGNL